MRFVAGRGAVAELLMAEAPWRSAIGKILLAGSAVPELLLAEAPWRSTIGKLLLAGALRRRVIGKMLLAGAPWRRAIGKMLLQGRCSEESSGRCCWPEFPAGRQCGSIGKQLLRATI